MIQPAVQGWGHWAPYYESLLVIPSWGPALTCQQTILCWLYVCVSACMYMICYCSRSCPWAYCCNSCCFCYCFRFPICFTYVPTKCRSTYLTTWLRCYRISLLRYRSLPAYMLAWAEATSAPLSAKYGMVWYGMVFIFKSKSLLFQKLLFYVSRWHQHHSHYHTRHPLSASTY